MLEKTTRMNYLFDFYQALLTPKQRSYMEMYYLEDLSLGEIAESFDVSRQAVYDNIRRTETMIESYEKKLNLYGRFKERSTLLDELEETIDSDAQPHAQNLIMQIKELD
ncbi:putative DNA-binding protein [Terribacillus sp. DMT04]|uniref:putative DNA-binding protein n=1 Tax=Terribacillus sp. DMT04 TaxID=2850441 RepID=UPI001C2BC9A5|nr:putative DNA-binding protein [Terribacillus sp. DMT04]QXE03072.1 putative DNA-binding protein [Terribacillus sp. DMT04]